MEFDVKRRRLVGAGTGAGLALTALLAAASPALADEAAPGDEVTVQVWHDLAPAGDDTPQGIAVGEPAPDGDGPDDAGTGEETGDTGWSDGAPGEDEGMDDGAGEDDTGGDDWTDDGSGDDDWTDEGTGDDGWTDEGTGDDDWTDEGTGDEDWTDEETGEVGEIIDISGPGDDGLVGICGWADGTEPSGPCNGVVIDRDLEDWTGWPIYMMDGVAVTATTDEMSQAGAGTAVVHRKPAVGARSFGALAGTGLAHCLALYPDLPWICEWQYGGDQ